MILRAVQKWAARILECAEEWLYPEKAACLCCRRTLSPQEADGLCERCRRELEALEEKRLGAAPIVPPPGIICALAAYSYEGPARRLIIQLKYQSVRAAAKPLARAMALLPGGEEEIIVPVPTTRKRLRHRGFNHAQVLAKEMGDVLGMQVCEALVRYGEGVSQVRLGMRERRKNLTGCMRADARVKGKRVLLVDDVLTTGATAQEAARALLEAGAMSVSVFAAAKTVEDARQNPPFALSGRQKA